MATWQPARFMVLSYTADGEAPTISRCYRAEREGWMRGIWGLHQGPWGPFQQIDWHVTHVPTGLLLMNFRRRRDAEWFVRRIERHPGWDSIVVEGDTITRDEALGVLVRDALWALERRQGAEARRRLEVPHVE